MKRFPAIKTGLFTIAIAGYPNVGKSSLLKILTNASPEIKEYAFTTKAINMGYFNLNDDKIQVIDTPGAFDRNINKMNNIEKQAFLALKHVANMIIFIIDPTEGCGYGIKQQDNLLQSIKSFKKPIITVHNKADLIQKREKDVLYLSIKTKEGLTELIDLIKHHKACG